MSERRVAIFDLDGTLVDSTYLHALAWWRAARENDLARPFADFHRLIGMGTDKLLEAAFGDIDEELSTQLEDAHSAAFEPLRDEVAALPGAGELLHELKRRGFVVAIATSGDPDDVAHARSVLDVDDAIDVEVNSSEAERSKPEPEIFGRALERSGCDHATAVAIGDTVWDMEAAHGLGIRAIGVLTGGHSAEDMRSAGAGSVHRHCAELLKDLDATALGE